MTDMLRFLGGIVGSHEAGWRGPWPPPETMGLAVGSESGMVSVFDPTPETLAELAECDTITVALYRLRNASRLPDDCDFSHVFRGAEYVPVEPSA